MTASRYHQTRREPYIGSVTPLPDIAPPYVSPEEAQYYANVNGTYEYVRWFIFVCRVSVVIGVLGLFGVLIWVACMEQAGTFWQ